MVRSPLDEVLQGSPGGASVLVVKQPYAAPARIVRMTFGPVADDLLPGAHNAVDTCLGIRRGERVSLVADEASREVAASLERALSTAGAAASCLLIESVA